MWEFILAEILPSLITLVQLVLGVLLMWLSKKAIDIVKLKVLEEAIKIARNAVRDIIVSVFSQLEQDVKKAAADGELTREEIETIKTNAVSKVKDELPSLVKSLLTYSIDNLDDLLGDWVEEFMQVNDFLDA